MDGYLKGINCWTIYCIHFVYKKVHVHSIHIWHFSIGSTFNIYGMKMQNWSQNLHFLFCAWIRGWVQGTKFHSERWLNPNSPNPIHWKFFAWVNIHLQILSWSMKNCNFSENLAISNNASHKLYLFFSETFKNSREPRPCLSCMQTNLANLKIE